MGKLFGTDGVRGIANVELTPELAYKVGKAGAHILTSTLKHSPTIVIGTDTRKSKDMLESALIAGICSIGANVICVGVVPTPAVSYLIRHYKADAGIVISASHNSYEFNGIKFFNARGYKLSDDIENSIEELIFNNDEDVYAKDPHDIGIKITKLDAIEHYLKFLYESVKVNLQGLKVAIDCANGAASNAAPKLLSTLGADVHVINNVPDGVNINKDCGSTNLKALSQLVKSNKFDIGIAFDGDADRALCVDEKGNLIDGDQIMAIIALELKKDNRLSNNTIVATVMSNLGLDIMAKKHDIRLAKTNVGDRYVLEEMLANNYNLGGEQSGHIILLDYNTTGDGLLTALKILKVLKNSNRKVSELASIVEILPQVLKNAKVKNENKYRYMEDEVIAKMCKELEKELHGEGRVLIRPSGTEPLIRVMIEGKDINYIKQKAVEMINIIEERLG